MWLVYMSYVHNILIQRTFVVSREEESSRMLLIPISIKNPYCQLLPKMQQQADRNQSGCEDYPTGPPYHCILVILYADLPLYYLPFHMLFVNMIPPEGSVVRLPQR